MGDSERMLDVSLDFIRADGGRAPRANRTTRVVSGTAGTWELRLCCLCAVLPRGSTIAIKRYNIHLAYGWQTQDPRRRDHVTVQCSSSAQITFSSRLDRDLRLTVSEGELRRGDQVVVRLGDRTGGGVGSEVFWTTTVGRLTFGIERDGDIASAAPDAFVEVVCRDEPACLRLLGPSVVQPGEAFAMHLLVFDINRNLVETFRGDVLLRTPEGMAGLPNRVTFGPRAGGVVIIPDVSARQPGVYRVEAALDDGRLLACSNPVVCLRDPSPRVYWGELHAHGWGDQSMLLMHDRTAKMDPAGRHEQARRVGRYDYGAPGAMAMPESAERECIWQRSERVAGLEPDRASETGSGRAAGRASGRSAAVS